MSSSAMKQPQAQRTSPRRRVAPPSSSLGALLGSATSSGTSTVRGTEASASGQPMSSVVERLTTASGRGSRRDGGLRTTTAATTATTASGAGVLATSSSTHPISTPRPAAAGTINLQTPDGVQRLKYQLRALAASETRTTMAERSLEAWRPSTSSTIAVPTGAAGPQHHAGTTHHHNKVVTIFMDALREHAVDPPTSSTRLGGDDAGALLNAQRHHIRAEEALLHTNRETLTVQVLLRETMRATTVARHETDLVAQALDSLVGNVVARHPSLMSMGSSSAETELTGGEKCAGHRTSTAQISNRSTSQHQPPWIDETTCFSPDQDATSVVQNHFLGQPQKIDAEEFLASQRALARVFFAGMREVTQLVRSLCSRKASLVQVLTNALESLVDNAHDASEYYASMVQDVASLGLAETVKLLSNKLRKAADEKLRLEDRVGRLEEENDALVELREDHMRLQERQHALDQFLKDQLGRNAAIMKMATQATGGVIPAHVAAAMSGGGYPGGGGLGGRRRSSRGKSLMRRASIAAERHPLDHDDSSEPTPNKANTLVVSTSGGGGGDGFDAPPFFLQGATDDDAPFTVSVPDERRTDDELHSDDFETADAAVQTGIEDAVNCQLVGEMNAYFSEMDKAANFSQALCRVVYGTTDFYNPGDCCDNARKLLEEITSKAQDLKDAAASLDSGATTSVQRSLMGGSSGANGGNGAARVNFATLLGYMDLPKDRVVKLLQYGSNAAREMRLRFASMSENESFRRAVEWRPPRGPRDPCRLCARLGPIPEDLAAVAESNELRARVAALDSELGEARSDIEKLHKRVEHERQVAQTHYDDVQAIYKVRFAMQHRGSQCEAVVKYSSGAQTDASAPRQQYQQQPEWLPGTSEDAAVLNVPSADGAWASAAQRSPFTVYGGDNTSLSTTPTTGGGGAGPMERSPYLSADAEWSQFKTPQQAGGRLGSGGPDATFLTRSAAVSARRRSSIEVTFDRDAMANDNVTGATLSARNSPGSNAAASGAGRQRRGSNPGSGMSPYSEAAAAAAANGGASGAGVGSPMTSANRRGSEMTVAALKYRDAFLSLTRAGSGNSSQRSVTNASFYGGAPQQSSSLASSGSRGSFIQHLQTQSHGIPSFYRDRVSPVDVVDAVALGNGPVKSHTWAIKLLAALYRTRYSGHTMQHAAATTTSPVGGDSQRTATPDRGYTCSRHFTDFLRQNFGTRQLIDDNAANFLRCVHQYAPTDARFSLFAKLFSDEYHREVYRHFLKFNAFLDQTQNMFESGGSSGANKRPNSDDQLEPATCPLESIFHCVYTLYWFSERIHSREEFCHLLMEHAVALSFVPRHATSAGSDTAGGGALTRKESITKSGGGAGRVRRASLAVKAFETTPPGRNISDLKSPGTSSIKVPTPPPSGSITPSSSTIVSALGTPIESSDSFSKYRTTFPQLNIPRDGLIRVVQRVAFTTYFCDVARPFVLQSVSEPSLSPMSSRPTSAPQGTPLM